MRCLVMFAALSFSATMYAQEVRSEYQFFGFSDDHKYVAFETFIPPPVDDASAFSKIVFVDVEKNDYAVKPLNHTGKPHQSTESVRKENMKAAQPVFAKYGIVPGEKLGKQLSLNMAKDDWGGDYARDTQMFVMNDVNYTLELHSFDTNEMHPAFMFAKQKFELVVKYNGKTQVLQRDTNVPASRGFVMAYKILAAYHMGLYLAVMLEYDNPGFEGYPDRYQMVVTGLLEM
jgi:predicted secreted protein